MVSVILTKKDKKKKKKSRANFLFTRAESVSPCTSSRIDLLKPLSFIYSLFVFNVSSSAHVKVGFIFSIDIDLY